MADVHQPLHAGYGEDRGGNSYQLQAFMRGTNLHAFWDSGLIRALDQDTEVMTARLGSSNASPAGRQELERAGELSMRFRLPKSLVVSWGSQAFTQDGCST